MTNTSSPIPHLLWFDLTQEDSSDDVPGQFADCCRISRAPGVTLTGLDLRLRPDMICLQYDSPDALGLNRLLAIKRQVPSIPVTMLTVQHSEELAIWAFRSGAWDYLVLPLANAERQRYLRALRQLCELRRNPPSGRQKRPLERSQELPESVRLTARAQKQQPLERVMQHIQQHFQEPLDQKSMADLCNMTPIRFSRAFKDVYGVGFLEFVQSKRMEHAHDLLLNSQMPVSSIAYASGFKDPSYFTRAFRQHYGLSPSEFRSRNSIAGLKLPVLPKAREAERGWSERLALPILDMTGLALPIE
ncbi:helix-turn-helix domain-containing protein [Azotobacter chroococcum]|uniref:Helix-turn-helix domain-containing protein n=1 Tax=Azotobacter chroococcum TaxID=353 RepID=A0AA44C7A2_9GAMM|nr:response regulator transcription factor [Azotobacter chroococcum]NHN78350.1 helix-turn-helix domain-containing protein [Azotobacter chroococcum]